MSDHRVERGFFEPHNTLNFKAGPSDILLHARPDSRGQPQENGILDFWFFHGGEQISVSDRTREIPNEIDLNPEELFANLLQHMRPKVESYIPASTSILPPNHWRMRTGDHLVLVGERPNYPNGIMVLDLILKPSALVIWLLADGTQPMTPEHAAVPYSFEGNPKAQEHMRHAVNAFLESPVFL
jgi:hypothetical protein